jgi:hypothetical protein
LEAIIVVPGAKIIVAESFSLHRLRLNNVRVAFSSEVHNIEAFEEEEEGKQPDGSK